MYEKSGKKKPLDLCSFKNKIRATFKYICSKIKRRDYFTVWFNCWRYEKEDELWAAFALVLMEQLSEQLSWWRRLLAQFKLRSLRLKFKWKCRNSIFIFTTFFYLFLRFGFYRLFYSNVYEIFIFISYRWIIR